MRQLLAALTIGAAAVTVASGPIPIAGAAPGAPRLTLVRQDAWTALGGTLTFDLKVEGAAPGLSVSLVAHQGVTSRAAFDRASRGESLGSVLDQVVVPFDGLPALAPDQRQLAVGLEAPGSARDPARLGIRRSGVYPLEVELRDDQDQTLSRFVTYAVAVDAGPGGATPLQSPLGVAWVWPLVAAPAALPDGTLDPGVVASFRPDGRLGRQAAALERAAVVPLTIVPGPETMQTWAAVARDDPLLANGADAIRSALPADQIVTGPYVPVDLPSLLANGLSGAVDTQLVQGNEALKRFFGARLDNRTALVRPVDGAALARERADAVDRVILGSGAVAPATGRFTSARPFTIDSPGLAGDPPVAAISGDGGLEALLGGADPPALRAQRFLAGLSLVALEQPGAARAVVIVNPDTFDPPASLLDAVLAGLRNHPWLRPMTVDQVFDQIPPESAANGATVTHQLVAYNPPRSALTAGQYATAVSRLNAFRALVTPADERVALAERSLASSVSSAWTGADALERAREDLGAIDRTIDTFLAQIHVPQPSTITLTSRSGEIPLTFENGTGHTVTVLVRLDSQKLFFPDGPTRLVSLPPKSTTIVFAVEARTSGSFPMRLSVRSADGALSISTTSFHVRSTAVSTVGLVLMVGAGVFLALWWGLDIRRRRRAKAAA